MFEVRSLTIFWVLDCPKFDLPRSSFSTIGKQYLKSVYDFNIFFFITERSTSRNSAKGIVPEEIASYLPEDHLFDLMHSCIIAQM